MPLRKDLRYRLDYLLVPDRLKRIEAVKLKIAELNREREEVRQQIPLWDRVVFFSDTPDLEREGDIAGSLETNVRVQGELREELSKTLDKVGREYPPFAVGLEIERCFKIARDELGVDGLLVKSVSERESLHEALEAMAERVLEAWVPDFDAKPLFEALSLEASCQRAAEGCSGSLAPHRRMGVEPLASRQLIPLVAKRLIEGAFFAEQRRLRALEVKRGRLALEHEEARRSVSLLDKVKVFRETAAEQRRDALAVELKATGDRLNRCYEKTRRLLQEALCAYPPLAVYQGTLEAMGVVSLLEVGEAQNLNSDGEVESHKVVVARALVYTALRRLLETFMRVFPDVPVPLALAQELSDGGAGRVRSPRTLLIREFRKRLDESWAPDVREQTLNHAAMQGKLSRKLKRVKAQLSVFDRIIFFVDSARAQEEERLEQRAAWHREQARRLWSDVLSVARIKGGELAPLAARDLAISACAALSAVRAEAESSKSPTSCQVYGLDPVLSTLREIGEALSEHYRLEGTREELMREVTEHPRVEGEPEPRQRFQILEHAEVVRRLKLRLQDTDFSEAFGRLRGGRDVHGPVSDGAAQARETTSLWDKVSVFTTTPATEQQAALERELSHLDRDVQADMQRVDGLFQRALGEVYPPAVLNYSLGGVVSAVGSIRAVSRSFSSSAGTGKIRRSEMRYRSDLVGKAVATSALRGWCAQLVATYGRLPDYHALLEECELGGIQEAGWQWD